MKQRFLTVLLTLGLLAAGFGTGIWTERHRPLPPPPIAFMGELSEGRAGKAPTPAQIDRAQLAAEIARMRPQIEQFRQKLDGIEADFDRDLQPLLTPAQRTVYARLRVSGPGQPGEPQEVMGPVSKADRRSQMLSAEQIAQLQQRPVFRVVDMVVVSMRLDWLVRELELDPAQRAGVQTLLQHRRQKFLALTDSASLPSLLLSRLAPVAERLAVAQ
ncbi:MAG: hypothetical protein JSS11_07455 [Verrucomicrobia bacterium]|nr:hypothetical protein [Verrucomicrobiota bacterium]